MKRQLRNQVAALCLLAPAALTFTALPATAQAQPASPEVFSLQVTSDNGVNPGSRLQFTLHGTPHARAFVRIRGVRNGIALREIDRGIYTGRYVVADDDHIDTGDKINAILRQGNRTVTASYDVPPGLTNNVAVVPPVPQLRIDRFQVGALDRIEPGAELRFFVEGMPGAVAFVDLPGVERNVRLQEVRPGHYEGSYTIRRSDNINPSGPVVATLRQGDRWVTANLNHPLVASDNRPPEIANLSPREGEVVQGPAVVSGNFDDHGGSGVDPNSVRIMLSGRNVTGDSDVSGQSFAYRGPLPAGRHTVDVTARDRAGNVVRRSWSFEVASAPPNVAIHILNQTNNGQVDGHGTHVRGRTAPFASVNVRVDAVPPVVGQFGVAQEVFARTLQADASGVFDFDFSTPFPVPGTRYDIRMTASKADASNDARLVLFQRQG